MMAGQKGAASAAVRSAAELLPGDPALSAERREAMGKVLRELAAKLGQ
jgi:hypothetical protein